MSDRVVELRITGAPEDAAAVHEVLAALLKGVATLAAPRLSTRPKYKGSALGRGEIDAAEIQKALAWRGVMAQLVADPSAGISSYDGDYFCIYCKAVPEAAPESVKHDPDCPIEIGRAILTT